MKALRFLLLSLCLHVIAVSGQNRIHADTDLQLSSRYGIGMDRLYEQGASPLHYSGPSLQWAGESSFAWRRYCILQDFGLSASMGFNPKSTATAIGLTIESGTRFLYLWHKGMDMRFRLWGGGGLDEYFHFTYLPELMNASYSLTDFLSLSVCFTVEYDFSLRKGKAYKPFTAFGSLNLPFAGIALRPGFSYMENYNDNLNTLEFLMDTYTLQGIAFSGVSVSTGIACTLKNHNRIGLSYDWTYRSSGNSGVYRFDHARHLLALSFSMNLLHLNRCA